MVKRIDPERCCGAIIDVQSYFLAQLAPRERTRIVRNTKNLIRLLSHFRMPLVATFERPIERKGVLPPELGRLGVRAASFEKDFYDLTKEPAIRRHLASLKRKQIVAAGCETDVCVLQSCLGLLDLGFEVFLVEEALFSSARHVDAALARLAAEGATLISYKTLYYELTESVDTDRKIARRLLKYGPPPDDLPDVAVT